MKVEDSPGSTGDTGLRACDMVGAETMVNVNILDEKFKGWRCVHFNGTDFETITCKELKLAVLESLQVKATDHTVASMRVFKNTWEHVPKPVAIPTTDHNVWWL